MSFTNLVAVVTGASSGIGRALAVALAAQGARVGATARRGELLDELVREVRASGGTIEATVADAGDRDGMTAAIHGLAEKLGPVDLLIANAGLALPSSAADPANVANVESMVRVNLMGVVYAFDAVLPSMLQRKGGHLVAISSMAAYKGLPGSAGYCAAKAAVSAYCESLRIDLFDRGVAVTCVCPGFIRTAMTAKNTRPMPFLMSPDLAAKRILSGLRRRRGVLDFPRRMRFLMWLSKWVPDRVMAKRVRIGVAFNPADDKAQSHEKR